MFLFFFGSCEFCSYDVDFHIFFFLQSNNFAQSAIFLVLVSFHIIDLSSLFKNLCIQLLKKKNKGQGGLEFFLSQWKIERKEEQGNYNSQED